MDAPLFKYRSNLDYPLVLAGRKAFVVLSRRGELSAEWRRWGPNIDYGGFYAPPQRSSGPIKIAVVQNGVRRRLGNLVTDSEYYPGYGRFTSETTTLEVEEIAFVPKDVPASALVMRIRNKTKQKQEAKLLFAAESWLGTIDFDGILPYDLTHTLGENHIIFSSGNSHFSISYSKSPSDIRVVHEENLPSLFKTIPVCSRDRNLKTLTEIAVSLDSRSEEALVVGMGASEHSEKEALEHSETLAREWQAYLQTGKENYDRVLESSPKLSTPDPEINEAYPAAVVAVEALKGSQPGKMVGVYAGLPWFAGFWGRDTGWILPALVLLGDHEWVRESLDTFLESQAGDDYKILGAVKGEVPTVQGHKTEFFYGAADATLYFPWLIHEYVVAAGDLEYAKKRWRNTVELVEWGHRKDRDKDSLVEHRSTTPYFATDMTWMDTEDRCEKAVEVQALWTNALASGARLAEYLGRHETSSRWKSSCDAVAKKIDELYWNEESGYLYDTIRPGGAKVTKIRPNAMIPLMFNLLPREKAVKSLERIEKDDMSTPWGVRTLSSEDPDYHPEVYHSGSVWPLITGWTAFAEYSYQRPDEGFRYLKTMAKRITEEGGMYAEAYRGDKPEPHTACILQGWSMSMFIWVLLGKLFGLRMDGTSRTLELNPQFPREWRECRITGLRMRKAVINITFDLEQRTAEIANTGAENCNMKIEHQAISVEQGRKVTISL